MSETELDSLSLLRRSSAFRDLAPDVLEAVAAPLQSMTVMGGQTLFRAGEATTGLFLLRAGSVGLFRRPQAGGALHLAGILGVGDAMGLTGLLLDQPHHLEARALRDSEVLHLSRAAYARLMDSHPRALLGSARVALRRLLARGGDEPRILPRTFAVLPFDAAVPARATALELRELLQPFGACVMIDAAAGNGRSPGWFTEHESKARFVLYVDEGHDPAWRDLCRRQADALLLVTHSTRTPAPWPDAHALNEHADLARPRHLLLLHPEGAIVQGRAERWCAALDCTLQAHHVRFRRDLARVARLLARRSTGLVLSGGGARGFAAIGLVRALREGGVEIDRVGGTSMGALIAAGVALEWSNDDLREHFRAAFVDDDPLSDWTLPLVALLRGERASRLLAKHFGHGDIQDLALPFYCVSADLTDGAARVHRSGSLWRALRAASSIPGLLPPLFEGGHVLVDGAVINDLPIDVMYDHGVANILACDIRAEGVVRTRLDQAWSPGFWQQWLQRRRRPSLASILLRTSMVNAEATANARRALASHVFTPPMEDIGLLDFGAFERAVEAGYRDGIAALEQLAATGSDLSDANRGARGASEA